MGMGDESPLKISTHTLTFYQYAKLVLLKSWSRNRLSQERLNSNAVCSIHEDLLESVALNFF